MCGGLVRDLYGAMGVACVYFDLIGDWGVQAALVVLGWGGRVLDLLATGICDCFGVCWHMRSLGESRVEKEAEDNCVERGAAGGRLGEGGMLLWGDFAISVQSLLCFYGTGRRKRACDARMCGS